MQQDELSTGIEHWDARRRQSIREIERSIDLIRNMKRSFGPHDPNREPWPLSRLRGIEEKVTQAYYLLTGRCAPADLLDEMADL